VRRRITPAVWVLVASAERNVEDGSSVAVLPVGARRLLPLTVSGRRHDALTTYFDFYGSVGWPPIDEFESPVVQLVLADAQGRFPWDDGCDAELVARQPIIDDDHSVWPRENRTTAGPISATTGAGAGRERCYVCPRHGRLSRPRIR
jgi:hypothetical protein